MNELEIFSQAIQRWGNYAQVMQAIEEMGELIVALNQYRRGRVDIEDVQTEIADVMIMAKQLSMIFGVDEVEKERLSKVKRLAERLKDWTK